MRGPRPTAAILCGAAVALLVARGAHAAPEFQPSTSVVLFTPAVSDPLVARLEAELAAVGIQVRKVNLPPERQLESTVTREIASGASAAIRVIPRSRGADVWTGDATARVLRRQTTGVGTADLSLIALQTVEFLRATLLGAGEGSTRVASVPPEPQAAKAAAPTAAPAVTEAPPPAREEPPPQTVDRRPSQGTTEPAPAAATAPDKRERLPEWGLTAPPELSASEPLNLEISAGPAVMASPGGVPLVASVAAIGRAHVSGQAGIELMAVLPLSAGHLSNPEGTVAVKTALFGGAIAFHLPTPRRLRADAAFGASALMFRTDGAGATGPGTAPTVGSVETAWKFAGHARLGGGVDLNRWLCLRADVIGGVTARTTIGYDVTTIDGRTIATDRASWGPAFATATLGLQASW